MKTQNLTREFKEFVVPSTSVPAREQYTYRTEIVKNKPGTWNSTKVIVEQHHEDGSVEDIYTYLRNYSMMKTFEPFRQLHDGEWHDYALISTDYTRFQVLDLVSREIIATEPYPTITEEHHLRWKKIGHPEWCENDPIGTEKPGWGFCPVEFYVPDWVDEFELTSPYNTWTDHEGNQKYLETEKELMSRTGQYALYTGCVWGDDSGGWKIRHIDLSRIREGIVTSDERYGYIQFAGKSLRNDVQIYGDQLVLPVELNVSLKTGKAYPIEANWDEEEG